MPIEISLSTVAVSTSVSIITSYFSTLINFSRLRNRHRRALGLSLLAEIKMLQRRLRHHYQLFNEKSEFPKPAPRLSLGTPDMTVFANGSGNLGLFTTRTAVEVLEYYNTVRILVAQAQALNDIAAAGDDPDHLRDAVAQHLQSIRLARHHSRLVVAALRRDTPMTTREQLRHGFRRLAVALRRMRRRIHHLQRLSLRPSDRPGNRSDIVAANDDPVFASIETAEHQSVGWAGKERMS